MYTVQTKILRVQKEIKKSTRLCLVFLGELKYSKGIASEGIGNKMFILKMITSNYKATLTVQY